MYATTHTQKNVYIQKKLRLELKIHVSEWHITLHRNVHSFNINKHSVVHMSVMKQTISR